MAPPLPAAPPGPARRGAAPLYRELWARRRLSGVARRNPFRGDPAMAVPATTEVGPGRQRALATGSPVDYMSITSFPRLPEEEPSGAAESGLRARKEEDAFLGEQDTGEGRRQSPPATPGTPGPRPRARSGNPRAPAVPGLRPRVHPEGRKAARDPGVHTEPPRVAWNVLFHSQLGLPAWTTCAWPPCMLLEHPPTLGCSLHIPRCGMLHPSVAQLE